jgi:hypothetical protein
VFSVFGVFSVFDVFGRLGARGADQYGGHSSNPHWFGFTPPDVASIAGALLVRAIFRPSSAALLADAENYSHPARHAKGPNAYSPSTQALCSPTR